MLHAVTMTIAGAEPVAGPSHGNSRVMQMTSELHVYSSQQLQSPAVCLPLSVQHLSYKDDEFHDDDGNDDDGAAAAAAAADDDDDDGADDADGDGDDGAGADDGEPQVLSVNSEMSELLLNLASPRGHPDTTLTDHTASTSTNVSDSTTVRTLVLILDNLCWCRVSDFMFFCNCCCAFYLGDCSSMLLDHHPERALALSVELKRGYP